MNPQMYLHPGPRDDSLLYLASEHRARHLFLNEIPGVAAILDFKRGDESFWKRVQKGKITVPQRCLEYIRLFGFEGVWLAGYKRLDRALVEALVERWRPETNTFHLPFGEATITLEDVNVLWGLPIEGAPLLGVEESYNNEHRAYWCYDMLGFEGEETDFKSYTLKTKHLMDFMVANPLDDHATDLQCLRRARCICLILASVAVLPDTNAGYLSLKLLNHLADVNTCRQLSWGSAALAFLYRELHKATFPGSISIGGAMSLVQMWAWTRIPILAPIVTRVRDPATEMNKPLAARWASDNEISRAQTPAHVLKTHRTQLQNLRERDFLWLPYRNRTLPEVCLTGMQSWTSQCYLIFWNIVEYHPVERVKRQFGYLQEIPAPFPMIPSDVKKLRAKQRKGRLTTNWSVEHMAFVDSWNDRHNLVLQGQPTPSPLAVPGYADWFHRHTVLYIKNPTHEAVADEPGFHDHGGDARFLVDGLSLVSQEADRVGNMGPDDVYQGLQGVRNMASHLVGSIHQIGQPSYIQTNDPGLGPDNTVPQHVPRGRGRGRGRRQRNQVNIRNDDDEGPSIRQFGGATPSYDSGPSTNRGSTPDYGGAGTSNVGGATHDWSPCYRPSFDHWGQGSSSFQPYNQLDVNNNQWFNQTPSGNMIPPIYSNQQGGFQNYDYTSHSVQQPRFQNVTPVQMSYESMEVNRTQPEDSDHDEDEERPRRQQPRNTRPVYCATGGHILRNYRRDHNN